MKNRLLQKWGNALKRNAPGISQASSVFQSLKPKKWAFSQTRLGHWAYSFLSILAFILLLMVYILARPFFILAGKKHPFQKIQAKLKPVLQKFYLRIIHLLAAPRSGASSRLMFIELAIRNMQAKRSRTMITIGGMALGIGAIVFLVSLGYGLQELVISRMVRLDEMKQADVSIQPGSTVKINDKTLADFAEVPHAKMVLPLVGVVGRVNYQNSVSDVAVYGVTSDYLRQSAIQPVRGNIFESNDIVVTVGKESASQGGENDGLAEKNKKIQDVNFSIPAGGWLRVRKEPGADAQIIGYTKNEGAEQSGEEIWGENYPSDDGKGEAGTDREGKKLGRWIKSSMLLWKKTSCDIGVSDCEDGNYQVLRGNDNTQTRTAGYIAEVNITVEGATAENASRTESPSIQNSLVGIPSSSDFVEIESESGATQLPKIQKVILGSQAKKEAIVNRALLSLMAVPETEAIGKTFSASFVVTGDLLDESGEKKESVPEDYTIVGVTPDDKTPIFYVPFIDIRSLGVTNYSQVKMVVGDQKELATLRKQIEAMGFVTRSVTDTVDQINSLFTTARTILALLGVVALGVAALGMFNTLTVSLLERTREIGLMKAMGMKSYEVKELFLTESMIMGFFGGLIGLLLGFLGGKILGFLISIFAIAKKVGYMDISNIPWQFVAIILFLSLLVGILTGIYPAKRATSISALNALRYE